MDRRPRVWVLPVVFSLIALSLPVQVLFRARVAEPFPGLFQPEFSGSPERNGIVKFQEHDIRVDGRRIAGTDLVPQASDAVGISIMRSTFPRDPRRYDSARAKAALRTKLTRALGAEPDEVSVAWRWKSVDLDSGDRTLEKIFAQYVIEFAEDAP